MRAPRKKGDWVYRGDIHDSAGGLIDNFGTYVPGAGFVQVAGSANATIHWLYDSANYRKYSVTVGGTTTGMPSFHRAEGQKPLLLRVQGWISFTPSTWAAGSTFFLGMRLGIFEQNQNTGNALFAAAYNMWNYAATDAISAAAFANDSRIIRDWRMVKSFADAGTPIRYNLYLNVKMRRRMNPTDGLGIYLETATGSTNLVVVSALRTFIVDED